jgi:hypothetical protein
MKMELIRQSLKERFDPESSSLAACGRRLIANGLMDVFPQNSSVRINASQESSASSAVLGNSIPFLDECIYRFIKICATEVEGALREV